MPLWAELERRGVTVESLVTAAMLPEVASRIATVAAMPAMREGGLWGDGVSSDVLDALQQQAESGWTQLLEAAMDAEGGLGNARKLALDSIQGAAHRSQDGGPQGFSAEFGRVDSETGAVKRRLGTGGCADALRHVASVQEPCGGVADSATA